MVRPTELVIFKDHGDLDVTSKMIFLQFEDTLTEEVPSLMLSLSAKRGRYLTVDPKVNFFDRIFVRLTDEKGGTVENVFEILKIKPIEDNNGRQIQLICSQQSWYVWQDHFSKQFRRESGFEVIEFICNNYNANKGASQPTIQFHDQVFNETTGFGNALSQATFNMYDYSNAEKKDMDGIIETVDRAAAPISIGGEFDFKEVKFIPAYDHNTGNDLDKMNLSVFSSGFKNGTLVTVDKDDLLNKVKFSDGNLEAITGTIIGSWGESNAGTLPTEVSQYFDEKQEFLTAKLWKDGIKYLAGMRVAFQGSFYTAKKTHTSDLGVNDPISDSGVNNPTVFWTLQSFTPTVSTYSPYTKDKAQYWINSGLAPKDAGTVGGRAAIFDGNVIIRDDNHRRTLVNWVGTNPTGIPSELLEAGGNPPKWFRALVNGSGSGAWAGTDDGGKTYADSIVRWEGDAWRVFLDSKDDLEAVDTYEGKAWVYNPCNLFDLITKTCLGGRTLGGWQWGNYDELGIWIPQRDFDCMHRYRINSANNPDFGNAQGIETTAQGSNSAVRLKFDFTGAPLFFNPPISNNTRIEINKIFCGINIRFPFPPTSNAIPWGPVSIGEQYTNEILERNNMNRNHVGTTGYSQGKYSEDLGPLQAFVSWITLIIKDATGAIRADGDFTWRMVIGDISDNMVSIDQPHPHNNNTENPTWKFDEAKIYRARPGAPFFPLKEIEVLNRFEWHNIWWISIYLLNGYEQDGRFAGVLSGLWNLLTIVNPFDNQRFPGGTAELIMDAPHFTKPLLSISHKDTNPANRPTRNLQPNFEQHPQVFNKVQNDNIAEAKAQLHQFERVEWVIRTVYRTDIKSGEFFYYTNPDMIDTTTDSLTHTEKLVNKKTLYLVDKGSGQGGRQRVLFGSKRFEAA